MESSSAEEVFLIFLILRRKLKKEETTTMSPNHFPKQRNKRALPRINSRNAYELSRIFFEEYNFTVLKKTFRRPIFLQFPPESIKNTVFDAFGGSKKNWVEMG